VALNASKSVVCHLIYRFDIGGLERVMVNCINAMQDDNYEHVVIALTEVGDFSKHLNPSVKTYQLNKKAGKDLSSHWRLFKLLRKIQPDILHTYNLAAIEYHPIAKLAGIKGHIHAEHGREISDPQGLNKKHNFLRKLMAPFIHSFVAVSSDLDTWLKNTVNINQEKVKLIRNGIDTNKFSGTESTTLDSGLSDNRNDDVCDHRNDEQGDSPSQDVLHRHSRGVLVGNPELKAVDSGLSDNRNDDVCDHRNDEQGDSPSQDVPHRHSRGVLVGNPELKAVDSGLSDNRNDDGYDNRHSRGVLVGNPELKAVDSGLSDNRNDEEGDNQNNERCVRFIHIARFNPVKDQQSLIQAFATLVNDNKYSSKQLSLTLVGDGELTDKLTQLVSDKQLNDFVIFTGARNDIPELLSQADVFVLSSIAEGIPMTVLEAMAASLPIISTDVGGLSELVENGQTGVLVEKQNAEVLAKAMKTYIDCPQLIARQGEQAHQFVEQHFSETNMVREYLNLYNESLGQN